MGRLAACFAHASTMAPGMNSARRKPGPGRPHARVVAAVLALLATLFATAGASAFELEGAWRPALPGETAEAVHGADPRLQRFDPARLHTFASPVDTRWLLLWPAVGGWPEPPWVLEVIEPGLQRVAVSAGDEAVADESWIGSATPPWPGHGRLSFLIDSDLPATTPLRLRLDATGWLAAALHLAARSVPDHLRVDARRLALASACLAIMAAMAVVALFFGLRLRDPAFLYYAIYVAAYAFILALQGGYVFDPLGW